MRQEGCEPLWLRELAMKIIIHTDRDLTPAGARRAGVPYGRSTIVWYVAGRKYHSLPLTAANVALTKLWLGA